MQKASPEDQLRASIESTIDATERTHLVRTLGTHLRQTEQADALSTRYLGALRATTPARTQESA